MDGLHAVELRHGGLLTARVLRVFGQALGQGGVKTADKALLRGLLYLQGGDGFSHGKRVGAALGGISTEILLVHQSAFLRHHKSCRAVLLQIGRHGRVQSFLVVARIFGPGLGGARSNVALRKIVGVVNMRGAMPLEIGAGQGFPKIAMTA